MRKVPVLLLVLFAALAFAGTPQAQLSVSVTASPQSVNSGFSSTFSAAVSGGKSPYTYTWTLGSSELAALPNSCTSASSTCTVVGTATTSTQYSVSVLVKDSSTPSISGSASADFTVNPYQCILGTAGDLGSCIADSIPVAAVGILLSLSFVAIVYMLGEVFKIEGFSKWYRTELWEVTKSMLIICTVYGALVIASTVSTAFASGVITSTGGALASATPCYSSSTLSTNLCMLYQNVYSGYLTGQLQQAYTSFSAIFGLSMGVGALKSVLISTYLPIPIPPPPFGVPYLALQFGSYNVKLLYSNFLEPTAAAGTSFLKDVMAIVVTPMVLIFQFQYDLLPAIIVLGLTVFLPMGVILRAIPFLRPIGGTLIGVGIGISLVYPVLLLTLNMPVTSYFSYVYATMPTQQNSWCPSGIGCTILLNVLSAGGSGLGYGMLESIIGTQNSNYAAYSNGFTTGYNINSIFPAMNFVTAYASDLALQFILFVLDLVIAIVAANTIARPLGGAVKLGIGKFKLA
jgi:hypothetical protein